WVLGLRALVWFEVFYCRGTGLEVAGSTLDPSVAVAPFFWRAAEHSIAAVLFTFAGRDQDALRAVTRLMPAVERAGGGVYSYTPLICNCCQALWRLGRADFADVLERNLLANTIAAPLPHVGVDPPLPIAHLSP